MGNTEGMSTVDVDIVFASVMVGAGVLAFVVALVALALAACWDRRDERRARETATRLHREHPEWFPGDEVPTPPAPVRDAWSGNPDTDKAWRNTRY